MYLNTLMESYYVLVYHVMNEIDTAYFKVNLKF
jgi:hypothetical protein